MHYSPAPLHIPDGFLNLVISLLSLLIGLVSDAAELRLAFGGAVIIMFTLGIIVCLFLLRTFRDDLARQQATVLSRVAIE